MLYKTWLSLTCSDAHQIGEGPARGTKTDRREPRWLLSELAAGEVAMVVRLDRPARSTYDLLNPLAAITDRKAGFRSLGDAWADTTTAHGRLMLTVLEELAEFERDQGETLSDIGRSYNVHPSTVSRLTA